MQFKTVGFKLIWFDGNRPAALREFIKMGTHPGNALFYLQMYRMEASKIIDNVKPLVVDPFDTRGIFKTTAVVLKEMRR